MLFRSSDELEARYEGAADPVAKSHFHALWLLSCGYEIEEVADILSFSPRWVRALLKHEGVNIRAQASKSGQASA